MSSGNRTVSLDDASAPMTLPTTPGVAKPRPTSAFAPGDCLGRYTVRGHLGAGGMGEVFSAHDPELDRVVAVKVLRPGLAGQSPEARARFQREAQAMARLNHPNVVSVHDVGTVGEDVFVAMELVDGPTLAAWLAERPRPWRDVVGVFLQAGRGLEAAHAAGMVHRDFKPSNVILGDRVRVADFGLARAAFDDPATPAPSEATTALSGEVTRTGQMVGTPAYMAPEQRTGGAVGPLSDQYSFAVALHEGLTGARPADPPPAGPPRAVPGWLRAVVERGLRERPEERYPAMGALLADLARDPARARRRWLAAASLALVVAGGGLLARRALATPPCPDAAGLVAPLWDDATRSAVAAAFHRTGRDYADDTFARVDAALRTRLGEWALAHRDACEATRVRHEQSDTMLDRRLSCLSRARADIAALVAVLGEADGDAVDRAALAAAEAGNLAACADLRALGAAAPPPSDPTVAARVELLRLDLARAKALSMLGSWRPALGVATDVIARGREVGYAPILAQALAFAGSIEIALGDVDAGIEKSYEAARVAALAHEDALTATSLNDVVFALGSRKQRFEAADVAFRAATAACARAGNSPAVLRHLYNYWGHTLTRKGEDGAALGIRLYVLALAAADNGPESYQVAMTLGYIASTVGHLGYARAARPLHDRSLVLLERLVGPQHPWFLGGLGNAALNRIDVYELDEGAAMLERAIAIQEQRGDQRGVASNVVTLAGVRLEQGRLAEARELVGRGVALRTAQLGADHPDVAECYLTLGAIEQRSGQPALAHRWFEQSLAIQRAAFGDEHPKMADGYSHDASALLALGRLPEARAAVERAIAIDRKTIGEDHPDHAGPLGVLADVLRAERRFAEAEAVQRRALGLLEGELGADSPALADPLVGLCETLVDAGDGPGAKLIAERAVRLAAAAPTPDVQQRAQRCQARAAALR